MFEKIFLLFPVLFSGYVLLAQGTGTINGVVRDSLGKGMDYVSVVIEEDQKYQTYSDSTGFYTMQVPAGRKVTLVFSSGSIQPVRKAIQLKPDEVLTVNQVVSSKMIMLPVTDIVDKKNIIEPGTVEVKMPDQMPSVSGGIEAYLRYVGAYNNNELSSAYSVRGGNFDENLVYVNDFEVYRPFLIRSGQQEGLSFVNTNMVQNVRFSTGGFQARYGDKMSSVLDVTYKKPQRFGGSVYGSLLGFGGNLEGCDKSKRFTFLLGVRQRLSQYVLRSLEEKGQYSPNFFDVQGFFTYRTRNEKWGIEYIVNYAKNDYTFKPVNRETSFGLLTDVKRLTVYFDGQEADRYQTLMNGVSLSYTPKPNLLLKILGSQYHNSEKEAYDILGEYYLSQVESDLGKSSFGDILYSLGVGGLHNWARNTLNSDIYYAGHRGSVSWREKGHEMQWGLDYKHEVLEDKISEWDRVDSAGHSIRYDYTTQDYYDGLGNLDSVRYTKLLVQPYADAVLRSQFNLSSNRISGFVQDTWRFGDTSNRFSLNYGLRFQWWDVNKEFIITPRVQFTYKPRSKKGDIVLTAAVGTYYQPPFYREMRNLQGEVNTSLKAQKSLHALVGLNYGFTAWNRKFSFVTEAYYKYLWDLVPFEYDNVLIRYFGNNASRGYAAGVDLRLNGELAEGAESWISIGIMSTAEDIIGDRYTAYYDTGGRQVAYTERNKSIILDSTVTYPGYIPRPTDQRVNFAMFFQDYIPKAEFLKVHLSLIVGTGLPFGPPDHERVKDTLRIPPYRRVDIGFSGQLWNPKWAKKPNKFNQGIKSAWISLEVFNLFGITNTVSYLWVSDIYGTRYAVPNYLTARRVNVKFMVNF